MGASVSASPKEPGGEGAVPPFIVKSPKRLVLAKLLTPRKAERISSETAWSSSEDSLGQGQPQNGHGEGAKVGKKPPKADTLQTAGVDEATAGATGEGEPAAAEAEAEAEGGTKKEKHRSAQFFMDDGKFGFESLASLVPPSMYSTEHIGAMYEVMSKCGTGLDSVVYAAKCIGSCANEVPGGKVAIKVLKKERLHEQGGRKLKHLRNEIDIWTTFHHPSVIALLKVVEDANQVHLVCDLMAGGELFEVLGNVHNFGEGEARLVLAQVASGLSHLHLTHSVAHRDLKSANILCAHERVTEAGCVKLADFGFARVFADERSNEFADNCGTLEYYAPELVENMLARLRREPTVRYSPMVDCWALGCVIYECLAGEPPFWSENDVQQVRLILRNRLAFPPSIFSTISEPAKELIQGLLQPDANLRLSMDGVLDHPWFRLASRSSEVEGINARLHPNVTTEEDLDANVSFNRKKVARRRHTEEYARKFSHTDDNVDDGMLTGLDNASPIVGRPHNSTAKVRVAKTPPKEEPKAEGEQTGVTPAEGRGSEGMFRAVRPELSQSDAWKGKWARRGSDDLIQDVTAALSMLPSDAAEE